MDVGEEENVIEDEHKYFHMIENTKVPYNILLGTESSSSSHSILPQIGMILFHKIINFLIGWQ